MKNRGWRKWISQRGRECEWAEEYEEKEDEPGNERMDDKRTKEKEGVARQTDEKAQTGRVGGGDERR